MLLGPTSITTTTTKMTSSTGDWGVILRINIWWRLSLVVELLSVALNAIRTERDKRVGKSLWQHPFTCHPLYCRVLKSKGPVVPFDEMPARAAQQSGSAGGAAGDGEPAEQPPLLEQEASAAGIGKWADDSN
jgi:hypothetical protein